MFGLISGSIIVIIRFIVKLFGFFIFGIGELVDLFIGFVIVLVFLIMYYRNKIKKIVKRVLILIVFVWVIVVVLFNWLFILFFYMNFYGFDVVLGMLIVILGINE